MPERGRDGKRDRDGTSRAGMAPAGQGWLQQDRAGILAFLCQPLSLSQHAQTSHGAPLRHLQPSHPHGLLPLISFTPPVLPSPLAGSSPSTITHLCRQLYCPWCDISGDVSPQQRHSAFPLLQAFLHHRQEVIPPPFLLPVPDILALFPAEGRGDCWWGCWPAKLLPQQQ